MLDKASIAQYGILGSYGRFKARQKPECGKLGYDPNFTLLPEYKIFICGKHYRLDFFVPVVLIAVEVDGREWHSTNKQREHDYTRERNLTLSGFTPLRFTANQAMENPMECLIQIYTLYCKLNVDKPTKENYGEVAD